MILTGSSGRDVATIRADIEELHAKLAKRLADPYAPRTRWLKIKNPDYSQQEGRRELSMGRGHLVALASDQRRTQKHA